MYFLNSFEPAFRSDPFALFREMEKRVQRAVNRDAVFPAVNLDKKDDRLELTSELPGINIEKLDLTVVGNTLTIKGERAQDELKAGERYVRQERASGQFSRTIRLPFPVNGDAVEAKYAQGVLRVVLPRAESDKPKKISIN